MRKPTARELKYQARVLLNGKYSIMALLTLLMSAADLALNYVLSSAFPSLDGGFIQILYLASAILCNMVYYTLLAGLMRIYLHLCRGEKIQISDLFSVFRDRPEQIAVYSVVPFILQSISSHATTWCFSSFWNNGITALPLCFLAILEAAEIWIELCLVLVLFLYCDAPWKSARQLITESWNMMRGNKGRMFYLGLSFFGVLLLGALSLGIGLLFVRPYLYVTQGLFYLDLAYGPGAHSDEETASESK